MSSKKDTPLDTPSTLTEHVRSNKAIFIPLATLIVVIVLVAGYILWQRSINNATIERPDDTSCEATYSKGHDSRVVIHESSTDCLLR